MRHLLFILLALCIFPDPALSQEVTPTPICFSIRNEAPYKVYGQVATDYYTTPDGVRARHTATFRFEKAGTTNPKTGNYQDRREFCSSGPFYPNKQLEITLRTLIPIFSCKTSIEMGELVIKGREKEDGTTKTWITCY